MAKIPLILVCSLLCLALGAAAGAVGIAFFGSNLTGVRLTFNFERGGKRNDSPDGGGKGGPGPMMAMMGKGGGMMGGKGGGMMGGKGGGMMGMMGGGGPPAGMMGMMGGGGGPPAGMMGGGGQGGMRMGNGGAAPAAQGNAILNMLFGKSGGNKSAQAKAASPTQQLNVLLGKVDLLTQAPLKLDLTKEQRKEIADHVAELSKQDLTDEAAQKHLDALLRILESQKSVLTAAGFRWPGEAAQDSTAIQERASSLQKRLNGEGK